MTVKFNWVSKEVDDATVHVAHTPYGDLRITEDKDVPWLHMRSPLSAEMERRHNCNGDALELARSKLESDIVDFAKRDQRNPLKFNTEVSEENNALARCAVTAFGNYSYKLRKSDDLWYIVALSTPRAAHSRFELTGFTKCYAELPSEITVEDCGGDWYSPEIEQFLTELHIRALRIECFVMGVAF